MKNTLKILALVAAIFATSAITQAMQVQVLPVTGGNYMLEAQPGITVGVFKQLIRDAKGIPTESQRLILNGRELRDGEDLISSLQAVNENMIRLVLRQGAAVPMAERASYELRFRGDNGQTIKIDGITARTTIADLTARIAAVTGIAVDKQDLTLEIGTKK